MLHDPAADDAQRETKEALAALFFEPVEFAEAAQRLLNFAQTHPNGIVHLAQVRDEVSGRDPDMGALLEFGHRRCDHLLLQGQAVPAQNQMWRRVLQKVLNGALHVLAGHRSLSLR